MDTEGLMDFIALAECKSFSKAAALRNVTQPAFSRRIRTLETALSTDLVDRGSKNFRLTAAGDRFLLHAANLVEMSARAVSDTKSLLTRLHEPVYVTAPAYLSKTFFPAWYKALQKSIPGLAMRISHRRGSEAIGDLHKGTADFALLMRAAEVEACYDFQGLSYRAIGKDTMVAVRARQLKPVDKFLMYEQGTYLNKCADHILRGKAAHDVVFETSSTGLLKEMALAGFGAAVLPESVVEDDLSQGYLVPLEKARRLTCEILLVRAERPLHKKAEKLWHAANSGRKS